MAEGVARVRLHPLSIFVKDPTMTRWTLCLALLALILSTPLGAVEHRIEVLDSAVPADAVSEAIAKQLTPTGISVYRGETRKICDIWLFKELAVKSFKAQGDVIYPLQPGQMVGVIRYPRRGSDFRDNDIETGIYTLRYAQQPVDGDHVGTSPTRDFLLLLHADKDKALDPLDFKKLAEQSAEVSGTNHPSLLSLQNVQGDVKPPAIRTNVEKDWWILRLASTLKAGDETRSLALEIIVVGTASE